MRLAGLSPADDPRRRLMSTSTVYQKLITRCTLNLDTFGNLTISMGTFSFSFGTKKMHCPRSESPTAFMIPNRVERCRDNPLWNKPSSCHEESGHAAHDRWVQTSRSPPYRRHRQKSSRAREFPAAGRPRPLSIWFTCRFCLLEPTIFLGGGVISASHSHE